MQPTAVADGAIFLIVDELLEYVISLSRAEEKTTT
jgi:hypothetical protein